jgi:hypothetical protein
MIQKLKSCLVIGLVVLGTAMLAASADVSHAAAIIPASGDSPPPSTAPKAASSECFSDATPGQKVTCVSCPGGTQVPLKSDCPSDDCQTLSNCGLIKNYVDPAINLLAALVGVASVISIVIAGIQYSSSAGEPAKASAAKMRIRNTIIALVAFALLYVGLNFLIPGGITSLQP